ncbi:hypothetical protein EV426DRAFT_705494 [Tirmania nivea]|nr:hypothetical protein EV426DRAFT_705494 [Tirmania nivea]
MVERFRKLGRESKLAEVANKIEEIAKSLMDKDEGFRIIYSREERSTRVSNKILVVKDEVTAERVLKIISNGLIIQDVMESERNVLVEKITVRTNMGSFSKEIKDGESENKAMKLKLARKGKKKVVKESLIEIVKVLEYFNFQVSNSQRKDKDQVINEDNIEVKDLGIGVEEVVRKGKERLKILEKADNIFGKEGLVNDIDSKDKDIVLINDIIANLKTIKNIKIIKGERLFGVRRSLTTEELKDEAVKSREPRKKILVQKVRRSYKRVKEEGSIVTNSLIYKIRKLMEMVIVLIALNSISTFEEYEKV